MTKLYRTLAFMGLAVLALATAAPQTITNINTNVNKSPRLDLDDATQVQLRERIQSTDFRLTEGMNDFAHKMFKSMSQAENGNIVFSPFSLHLALSMIYYGSPEDSETHQELVQLLGLSDEFQSDYATNYLELLSHYDNLRRNYDTKVQFANKIYTNEGFEPKNDFQTLLRLFYRTSHETVNFEDSLNSVQKINDFVAGKTNGLIRDLLSPGDVDALTRMVLINAIYFKANWLTQFDREQTKPGQFKINGKSFEFPTMMNVHGEFGSLESKNYDILEMPYEDDSITMYIILPKESVHIRDVENQLSELDFSIVNAQLSYGPTKVKFPKFTAGFKSELKETLGRLGVETLFNLDRADLSDITEREDLAVQKLVHQAQIVINEEGSEAAAATAGVIGTRTVGVPRKTVFNIDRPFLFVIHDKDFNVPIFMGRIVDPSGERQLSGDFISKRIGDSNSAAVSAQQEDLEQDLPDCSELGYDLVQVPNISFPCKGRDTRPVEDHMERQRNEKRARMAKFLKMNEN